MKKWAINMFAKLGGAGKLWAWLDGKKAYGTGFMTIIGGVAGLAAELAPILASHNTAGFLAFLSQINSDPSYLAFLAGCGIIAAAGKADKYIAAAQPAAEPAPEPAPAVESK